MTAADELENNADQSIKIARTLSFQKRGTLLLWDLSWLSPPALESMGLWEDVCIHQNMQFLDQEMNVIAWETASAKYSSLLQDRT